MIFASDLDNTLIHSFTRIQENTDVTCVEYSKEKPLSYMLTPSIDLYRDIINAPNCLFLPVTARNTEQYGRILLTKNCKNVIAANGGIIYINGQKSKEWDEIISKITATETNNYSYFMNILQDYTHLIESGPRLVDNTVIFAKFKDVPSEQTEPIKTLLSETKKVNWDITIQGKKIYVAPEKISKEDALAFFLSKMPDQHIVTAGDGMMDVNFINMGHTRFIPENSEAYHKVQNKTMYHIVPQGPEGTYEMLTHIKNLIKKEE